VNCENSSTVGSVQTSEPTISARRPCLSANDPEPSVPNALASVIVVASAP
jgi:hypothetical protein